MVVCGTLTRAGGHGLSSRTPVNPDQRLKEEVGRSKQWAREQRSSMGGSRAYKDAMALIADRGMARFPAELDIRDDPRLASTPYPSAENCHVNAPAPTLCTHLGVSRPPCVSERSPQSQSRSGVAGATPLRLISRTTLPALSECARPEVSLRLEHSSQGDQETYLNQYCARRQDTVCSRCCSPALRAQGWRECDCV